MEAAQRVEVIYDVPLSNDRWLLEDETMPETPLHDAIIRLLVEILIAWNDREGGRAAVGRNIALRWNEARQKQGVDPDVYVVDPAPPADATSLCLWKPGHHPPRVAVEVVSESTADKDYGDGPDRYAASGTRELWVFDPLLAGPDSRGGPHLLQVWRRDDRGRFRRVYAGAGPARSEELDAFLVVTDGGMRLRVAEGPDAKGLWATAAEAAEAARKAAEAARADADAEVVRLREELARLRRTPT